MGARISVREALGRAWDDGNAVGLDGWVGPGRGTEPVDREAVTAREREVDGLLADVTPIVQHAWRVDGDSLIAFCGDPKARTMDWPDDATSADTNAVPVCTPCHRQAMKAARDEERQGRGPIRQSQIESAAKSLSSLTDDEWAEVGHQEHMKFYWVSARQALEAARDAS